MKMREKAMVVAAVMALVMMAVLTAMTLIKSGPAKIKDADVINCNGMWNAKTQTCTVKQSASKMVRIERGVINCNGYWHEKTSTCSASRYEDNEHRKVKIEIAAPEGLEIVDVRTDLIDISRGSIGWEKREVIGDGPVIIERSVLEGLHRLNGKLSDGSYFCGFPKGCDGTPVAKANIVGEKDGKKLQAECRVDHDSGPCVANLFIDVP